MRFDGLGGEAVSLIDGCASIVQTRFARVDAVLVGGDLTDHAEPSALELAWKEVNALALRLDASLVATAGNHDYDSRGSVGFDPKGALIALEPPFPAGDAATRLHYFAYDFAVVQRDGFVVVTLNSAAQHGYSFGERHEYEHGRVLPRTIARIRAVLDTMTLPSVRILLVHHHVVQLPDLDTDEQSILTDADPLMRMLAEHGDWIVVHGHKHRPWMQYAAGGGDAPVVFSAGTFAANLGVGRFAAAVQKQFYVVEFNSREDLPTDLAIAGQVHAWNFDGFRWVEAGAHDGYPGVSGFGWRTSTANLADRLHDLVVAERRATNSRLEEFEPRMLFLCPDDQAKVLGKLSSKTPPVESSQDSKGKLTELFIREAS
jgi:predicted phosphodiesterase